MLQGSKSRQQRSEFLSSEELAHLPAGKLQRFIKQHYEQKLELRKLETTGLNRSTKKGVCA